MPARKKREVFIIMAMSDKDPNLEDVHGTIKRVCETAGVHAQRVDEIEHTDRITDKIIDCITRADIIIADLTHERPNVYYELGYCHGMGKSVILTARQGTVLHFDIKDFRVLFYKNMTELEGKLSSSLQTTVGQKLVRDYMREDVSRFTLTGRERGIEYLERLRQGEEEAYAVVDEERKQLRGVLTPSDIRIKRPISREIRR